MPWSRAFEDPIPLSRGRQIVTLKDAAAYILKLPKTEQHLEDWQARDRGAIDGGRRPGPAAARAHRHAEGTQSGRRAGLQSSAQRYAEGKAEVEEG
jgi:hypothetical protein